MPTLPLHEEDWEYVQTLLPSDLEESARSAEALVRCRNVPNAAALIRMALAYAVSDLSLTLPRSRGQAYFIVYAKPRGGWSVC